ncbi:MAG TPA: hypothetical protein DDY59_10555 [Lachnospiraceae bacterium]|jgi:hypothetical protein|nr:hypothetical protein [Lachnospiraceae bacterium]HCA69863.1 hypothetical protein [Lachnospiraceae bacterium]HCM14024.1 hypothetical protein [Lachnospiraceae bacterium]HCR40646.1 hypothetical protein [Lachnospiraceae bacterium]
MSATAFQRRRRERIKAMREEAEKQLQKTDYSDKTKEELKAILDEKGIAYDARAKKEDLIKLLEGAE